MRFLDRVAIVVQPKQPFFDWASSLDGAQIDESEIWRSVYLVAASDGDEPQDTLRRQFDQIFEEQLESWNRDDTSWPTPRTFTMFQDWFDAKVGDMVVDLSDDSQLEYDD